MGAKAGKTPSSSQPSAARQLRLSSSSLGSVIPLVYGEQRIAANLLHGQYFSAIAHSPTTGAGGKAGAMASGLVTRTYAVSALLALCEGALDASDPDFAGVAVASPQQVLAIGRATPGDQVLTVSDATGRPIKRGQPVAGWSPAVWIVKKVRRVVNDNGKSPIGGDTDGEPGEDGDDKDDRHNFRPARWHNWDEPPDLDVGATVPRFISGPSDLARGPWKNALGPAGKRMLPQRDAYIILAGENYFGIGCVARQDMRLGSNASLPNWNFPVRGLMQYRDIYAAGTGAIYGADPACVLFDCLTNPKHGAGWDRATFLVMLQGYPQPWGALDATPPADSWSAYCRASNILLSPFYDSQRAAADIVSDLAEATNTAPVWSEGRLKMIPYGDQVVTSAETGITYTPTNDATATTDGANLAPRYALTLDDFLPGKNKDYVHVQRRAVVPQVQGDFKSDGLYNHVRVEFLNAAKGYAIEVAEAKDSASIALHGVISREPYQRHDITTSSIAQAMAERQLKRLVSVRNVYSFSLGWAFLLLEPMDVLTLPGAALSVSLAGQTITVRVTMVEEDKDGALSLEAEDFPVDLGPSVIPVEPPNPDPTGLAGGVTGGGLYSIAPSMLGIVGPTVVDGQFLPPGAMPGTVYKSIDPAATYAEIYSPQEVCQPIPIDMVFTALAVRAYLVQTADPPQPAYGFRWRLFVIDPNGAMASQPGLEVRFGRDEVQWRYDAVTPTDPYPGRQTTSSSKVTHGSIFVEAGSQVCIEMVSTDPSGNPMPLLAGTDLLAIGEATFTATVGWEIA